MRKYLEYLACIPFVVVALALLPALFIRRWDESSRILTDGWGRELGPTPFWLRIGMGIEMWPGFWWWLAEMVAFFGTAALAAYAISGRR